MQSFLAEYWGFVGLKITLCENFVMITELQSLNNNNPCLLKKHRNRF